MRNRFQREGLNQTLEKLKHHDKQLIANHTSRRIPSGKQLRFFFRFLSKKEFWWWAAGVAAILVGASMFSYGYIREHRLVSPDVGGEYREIVVGTPRLINPLYNSTNEVDQDLTRLMYSGLLRYNAEGALVPDLTETFSGNVSSTEYTAVLRNNLVWHDGTTLTADDVLFTIDRIKDPTVASPLRLSFQGVTTKKADDRTIIFKLEKPFAAFGHALTVGILPRHIWNDVNTQSMKLADANTRPIGSGPYAFEALSKSRTGLIVNYTLKRNEQFYRGAPFIERLQFLFAPDLDEAINTYTSKRADGVHFIPKERKEELTKRATNIYSLEIPQYTALFFNQKRNPALEKTPVRKALALAINKQQIIDEILLGDARPLSGPLPPGSIGYRESADPFAFNPTASLKLLDEAGWGVIDREGFVTLRTKQLANEWKTEHKDDPQATPQEEIERLANEQVRAEVPPSQQTFRKNKSDQILTINLTTVNNKETIRVAESVQSYWQAIGVHTVLTVIDSGVIQSDVLRPRNYEVLLFGEVLGPTTDPYPFWHSSQIEHPGLNLSLYINRKADTLLEEARASTQPEERTKKYLAFQELLDKDVPAIFLYNPKYLYLQNKKVQEIAAHRIWIPADRFNEVERWYIKTQSEWK